MNWFKRFWKSLGTPMPASGTPTTTKITIRGTRDEFAEATSNFTPAAQQILSLARNEADRLHHNFVGTEHVLLGLIKFGKGVAVNVLVKQGLDLEALRLEMEKQVGTGPDQKIIGNIPFTPRVKKAIALAQKEARQLKHVYVGTEHILLGLLREGDGVAAKIMKARGIDLAELRTEILRELDPNYSATRSEAAAASQPKDKVADSSQLEPMHERLFKYIKPDPVDLTKRYDVYCIQHGESVVYRNVLFKGVKGLLPNREFDITAEYIELEPVDGKSVFLPKHTIFKFAAPGAAAEGEPVPPKK